MIITREWAMPNHKTFQIEPIKRFLESAINGEDLPFEPLVIVDPFANDCKYGTIRNDLNPSFDTEYHMDALDFLKMLPTESADIVLYDPPYSLRQVKEHYEGVGMKMTQENAQSSWRSNHLDEIARITKLGGLCLCFGWNSNGVGMKRHFYMEKILLVAHGGSKNDTICTCERKDTNKQLTFEYGEE